MVPTYLMCNISKYASDIEMLAVYNVIISLFNVRYI